MSLAGVQEALQAAGVDQGSRISGGGCAGLCREPEDHHGWCLHRPRLPGLAV